MVLEDYLMTHDAEEIHYKFYDNKKPVLMLVHGMAMDIDSWHHQIEHFKNDYSVLAYDLRGHGKSSKTRIPDAYSMNNFIRDIGTLADELKLGRFSIVGFSMGGTIAMEYARENSERIDKLVAINAPYSICSVKPSFFLKWIVAKSVPEFLISIGIDDGPIWRYKGRLNTHRKCFKAVPKYVIDNIIKSMRSSMKFYVREKKDLISNHLLIYSEDDEIVRPIPPKGSNSVIIKGGHHYVIAQKPGEINKRLDYFLSH